MPAQFRALIATVTAPTVFIAELPITGLQYQTAINAPATATVEMPLDAPGAPTIAAGSTVLWIERNDALVFGGVIWAVAGDAGQNTATVSAGDFLTYLQRRTIRTTQTFTNADQLDVARAIVDYANAVPDALNIIGTAGTNTSGVNISRTFPSWERKNVGAAIEQLADVNNGFDFVLELTYQGNTPTVELVLTSPNTGNPTDHVFDLQANIETLSFTADATQLATQVDALGSGEGPDKLVATATQASSAYALTQTTIAFSDIAGATLLGTHADRQLALRRAPITAVSAVIRPDVDPLPGTYAAGDIVELRAKRGLLDIAGDFRITTLSTAFANNQERITATFAEAAAFGTI